MGFREFKPLAAICAAMMVVLVGILLLASCNDSGDDVYYYPHDSSHGYYDTHHHYHYYPKYNPKSKVYITPPKAKSGSGVKAPSRPRSGFAGGLSKRR